MLTPLFAYLDPGAGATILQIVLAGTAGVAAAAKIRMNRIKRRLGRAEETEVDAEPDKDGHLAE